MPAPVDALFLPFSLKTLQLPNRTVMAPMTRSASPDHVPGLDVAAYYRRRAEGGVGLIVTEGVYVPMPQSGFGARVPAMYGDAALAGWRHVVSEVHAAGGLIMPQLWHVGAWMMPTEEFDPVAPPLGPSGVGPAGSTAPGRVMIQADIDTVIDAYATAAANAKAVGFDGVEIHAAHGYLLDQFFWGLTNRRTDRYGGDIGQRTLLAQEVLAEMRRRVGPDFPIILRFSQWKLHDFTAKAWVSPSELEAFLVPLVEAGVDAFHCSTRRFWLPEFEGSPLNLAGWTKKLVGIPVITVGSVTLGDELMAKDQAAVVPTTGLDELLERLAAGEFDLVAIGRAIIANPDWPRMVQAGAADRLKPYDPQALAALI
jgi:2,4-dienoyl-CoA reductase-like NADH-dependent reductase (Old Yellow Enzyme family)